VFSDEALAQIARYYRLAGARRCHKEDLGGAGHKLALDLLDGGPLELVQDDTGDIVLMIFGRLGIYLFDRAAKPIYFWSLAGGRARGALHFRRRPCPVGQLAEKLFGLKGGICASWTT